MMVSLKINHVETQMELDTGSAVSVMAIDDYKEMFGKFPKMEPFKLCLRTYTKELVQPLSTLYVKVDVNKQVKTLSLLILNKGGNLILRRDWLSVLKLDWRSINHIPEAKNFSMSEYLDVFAENIWKIKNFRGNSK
ncbi:Pol polyprotein [Plakobranchus ocellatus]|uniref:Pol polyprotein n=1 Tax=Plakobranchus ocellatus TaxID=259542 RepID=A0AAV3ZHA4_9GAST|nr:Pol polyprotein [Plakobranchus ocellatus]